MTIISKSSSTTITTTGEKSSPPDQTKGIHLRTREKTGSVSFASTRTAGWYGVMRNQETAQATATMIMYVTTAT